MNSNLVLKPINDLLGEKFFVPSYQRGYRWSKKEVIALLDDIFQFFLESQNAPKEAFYCLQPLVVSKKGEEWVLVDGQQRLTTIYLILTCLEEGMKFLGKEKYSLRYETRPGSETFLQNIDETRKLENIDYYHICEALEAIRSWIENKGGSSKMPLLSAILNDDVVGKNVKVIWYIIDDNDSIDIFSRINMGKIPLTNAELIKALFLKKDNFNTDNEHQMYLSQLEIASEWDRIENTLQMDTFWYFIHDNQKQYDTRIEFIFDLMKKKNNQQDDYYTFIEFSKDFKDNKNVAEIWIEIKRFFMTLEEWYSDHTLYHMIGFLVATGTKLPELLDGAQNKTKSDFNFFLKETIKAKFNNVEFDDIYYPNSKIKNILLLFNIETILQSAASKVRFPFDEYKIKKWDIEHISSVKSDMPGEKKREGWLKNVYEYFKGSTVFDHFEKGDTEADLLTTQIYTLLKSTDFNDADFTKVYLEVIKYFKEDNTSEIEDDKSFTNSLANLTLLDSSTNRSYQNAVFPIKRKRVLKNDKEGLFVPICTKNVFLKYYSERLDNVMFWQQSDADDYLLNIKETLKEYL